MYTAVCVGAEAALAQSIDSVTRQRFQAQDGDGDGRIELAEFEQRYRRRFALFDRDHNGGVTEREFIGAYARRGTLGPLAAQRYRSRFARQDKNGDGLIVLEEHLAFAGVVFDYMDRNNDRRISLDEFAEAGSK